MSKLLDDNINIDEPRYDQNTFEGRALHFFGVTNPINIFATSKQLNWAKNVVTRFRNKEPLPECIDEENLWRAKTLYDSAFHPETGEKMMLIGRMSAQVPMNMLITGGMMTFYKSNHAVIFWQWLNQTFNALVNYTNRGGGSQISTGQLFISYILATGGATGAALGLNRVACSFPPVVGRMVPFAAVAVANCINIPLMRSQELSEGIPVTDANKNELGISKRAAKIGIGAVILSRIIMAAPGMVLTPFVMNRLERRGTLCRYPWATLPIQVGLLGVCLTFATPLCCAIFRQRPGIKVERLEPELQEKINSSSECPPKVVYFNKGL